VDSSSRRSKVRILEERISVKGILDLGLGGRNVYSEKGTANPLTCLQETDPMY
jgi:hypothetical protein